MKKPVLCIGYLSSIDPNDKKLWSGTHYSIYNQLKKLGNVIVLGPFEPKWQLFLCKVFNQIILGLFNSRFDYRHSFFISKAYARFFNRKIERLSLDVIVAPAASSEIAFIRTSVPVIYITDGTFASCLNYHESLSNLIRCNVHEGNEIEKRALQKCSKVVVPSYWAFNSVIKDYGTSENKVVILPFGANLEKLPTNIDLSDKIKNQCKLLFVGVYWKNKGGDVAFKTLKLLKERGINVSLTVLGCVPPDDVRDAQLSWIPFIDKNSAEGQERISQIFAEHHFLILPTRFDCSPIVINEASAFGVPSIVRNTGGVEGHLIDGKNGYLIDADDTGEGYSKKIAELIASPNSYLELCNSTRQLYIQRLNWTKWKSTFSELLVTLP